MTNFDHEDLFGAKAAQQALLAADFAWRLIAALSDPGTPDPLWGEGPSEAINTAIQRQNARMVIAEAFAAGVKPVDLACAEIEIRRAYLSDSARQYLAQTARDRLVAAQFPEPDGPGPDAEDYRVGSVDDCTDDDFEWPA